MACSKKRVQVFFSFLLPALYFSAGLPVFAGTFEFSGDRFSTVMAKGREYTVLSGNARIVSDSTTITASRIELYGDDYRFAECFGRIRVEDSSKGFMIQAEKMVFDRIGEVSRLEGAVVMEDLRNEVVIKGNYLEYSGKTETATIQIGARILQEDMACRSEFARYSRETKILELSGLPVVHWKGDEYRALKITINLDTDEIFLEGKVSGTIYTEQQNSGEPSPAGESGTGASGTGAPKTDEYGTGMSAPGASGTGETGPLPPERKQQD